MTSYFWTTTDDRGDSIVVAQGGHYEALKRSGDATPKRASLKGNGTIIPSSDIPEVCVSASPAASLFAKLQGVSSGGTFYIYKTEEQPDTDVTGAGLDFAELEEYRYTMTGDRTVAFSQHAIVTVPQQAAEDVELAYEMAEAKRTNTRIASAVKNGLSSLIEAGQYNRQPVQTAMAERFEDFADSYGLGQAERLFGTVPDGVDTEKYD